MMKPAQICTLHAFLFLFCLSLCLLFVLERRPQGTGNGARELVTVVRPEESRLERLWRAFLQLVRDLLHLICPADSDPPNLRAAESRPGLSVRILPEARFQKR